MIIIIIIATTVVVVVECVSVDKFSDNDASEIF